MIINLCQTEGIFNVPREGPHEAGRRKDVGLRFRFFCGLKLSRKGVWFYVAGTWNIGDRKVKTGEKQ